MNYELEDRSATKWGNAAVELAGTVATIEDVCRAARESMSYTREDLTYLATKCRAWGIVTSVDKRSWYEAQAAVR